MKVKIQTYHAKRANIAGSIMLYDSFVDHRAVEHHGMEDRYVLYYEFETRGIFTGYVDGHFGAEASKSAPCHASSRAGDLSKRWVFAWALAAWCG